MILEQIGLGEEWNYYLGEYSYVKIFPNDDETSYYLIKMKFDSNKRMNYIMSDENQYFERFLRFLCILMSDLSIFYSKNAEMLDILSDWIYGKMEWYIEQENAERSEIIRDIILYGEYYGEEFIYGRPRDHGMRSHKL